MKHECKGGKKSKHRVTIAFFVDGAGESESLPIVIWKSKNTHCFKGGKKENLPVIYYSQVKSWMTGEILHEAASVPVSVKQQIYLGGPVYCVSCGIVLNCGDVWSRCTLI